MNKYFKYYLSTWVILLAIFNSFVFLLPWQNLTPETTKSFWLSYGFITASYICHLIVSYLVFKENKLQKIFYKIPMLRTSGANLILSVGLGLAIIFGTLTMVIPDFPIAIGFVICFTTLGLNVIALLRAHFTSEEISRIDDDIKERTFYIKALTVDAERLLIRAKSDEVKSECKKVYEAVRYSDPMSKDELKSIEEQISAEFSLFSDAVLSDDKDAASNISKELENLIGDRNKKCKLLK